MRQLALHRYAKAVYWKPLLALAFLIAMVLFLYAIPAKALGAQPDISVSIIPSTATFSADDPTSATGKAAAFEIEVEVSNLSTQTLQKVRLCWFTNANITVNNLPSNNCLSQLPSLAPTGQYIWTVNLTRTGFVEQQNSVQFRVEYQIPTGVQNRLAQRYAFNTLTVQNVQPQSIQQVAQLTVLSSLGTVNDQQSGQIFLVVQNKSNFELSITKLITKGPTFVTLDPLDFHNEKPIDPLIIDPGQQITTAINVTANGPVPPGAQTLVFEVGVQWIDSGQVRTGNLVANQQVNLGVLGASEITNLLGIPSLLVLPGFLIVTTLMLLKKVVDSPINKRLLDSPATAEFWLVAITMSIVADVVYFLLTRHKFWAQYNLTDVVIIWLGSILFAIVFYFIIVGIVKLVMFNKSRHMQRLTPELTDTAVEILGKLDNQKLNLVRDYVRLKIDGEVKRVFLLQPLAKVRAEGQTECWVSPAISVQWQVCDDPSLLEDTQNEFNEILKSKNAGKMAAFLEAWDERLQDKQNKLQDKVRQNHDQQVQDNHTQAQDQDQQNHVQQTEGDQAEGDQAEGDQVEGDQAEGDQAEGDQAEGDQVEGDQAEGNQVEGNQVEGDQAEGDQAQQVRDRWNKGSEPAKVDWRKLRITKDQKSISGPYKVKIENIIFDSDQQFIIEQDFRTVPD